MVKKIKKLLKKNYINRTIILALFFCLLSGILIGKLYNLQIINGEEYANSFSLETTKVRSLESTRGNILDRDGKLLAYNELIYSITLEDNGSYNSTREKNLSLNSEIYRVIGIVEANGDSMDSDFHIIIDEHGEYQYDVSGTSLSRFKADVYGKSSVDDMTPEEAEATADKLMSDLIGSSLSNSFMIVPDGEEASKKPYTQEELEKYGLPSVFTKEEILKIATVRYQLFTTSYRKYLPVTIATDVSAETVAAIMENQSGLQGIDVIEDSKRVYNDSIYFASLIGYTGKASTEELEELTKESDKYDSTSIVGKSGIEQYMETMLQGTDGSETVYVDKLGKVLEIDDSSRIDPVQGDDVYLTIDADLQIAAYKILEQRIAGIVLSNLQDIKSYDPADYPDSSSIPIPIYDVYFAIINNDIVDYREFAADTASDVEKRLNAAFVEQQKSVFEKLADQLNGTSQTPYKDLSDEYQKYQSYIINTMLNSDTDILMSEAVDKDDETYIEWTSEETISIYEFLRYAVKQDWIDVSQIAGDASYLSTDEILSALIEYIIEYLQEDTGFSKLIYKYMLLSDVINPSALCLTLFDEGVLEMDETAYSQLSSGELSAWSFMYSKIQNLEITPAQLALDPCSGSVVITDPNTGDFLAVVSYPGYDNNKLANQMDTEYYYHVLYDLSEPFYNKATQQKTAPGSTFKPVTAVAALSTGIIDEYSQIYCGGVFDLIQGSPLRCWNTYGHGSLNIVNAIKESCNVFFAQLAYNMGLNDNEVFSETKALSVLQEYAELFDLDKNTGIEISESSPQVTDSLPIPSAIGQGTHNYTTSQLARYVSTIANSGVSYNMTILDKVTDSQGNLLEDYSAEVESILDVDDNIWDIVHTGMRKVITSKAAFDDLDVEVAGKTGTAQESKTRASHGLFIGYAPYDDPEMAICVRIAHGYSSTNAAMVAKDIFNYYFNLKDEEEILTGKATLSTGSNEQQD